VHAFDGWPFGVYGYVAVWGRSKKFFINGVGTYTIAPLYSTWLGPVMRRVYKRAKGIFCISSYVQGQLLKAGVPPGIPTVVHLGTDRLVASSPEDEAKYRAELSISRERFPIVLTVGDVKTRKGQLDTLQAVGRLKEKYPQILYVVVGTSNDAYAKRMSNYAESHGLSDNLRLVSSIEDAKLSFLYSICTLVALNSNNNEIHHHFEGFGLVVIEGYQFGKPAVGSRNCGIEDAIVDGKTGLLANQSDPADIAEKIGRVIENLAFFSHNASMEYAQFDWKHTVAAYIAAYNK
jgi:glycosyltransferase involved in cell wall biosynthesis